MSSGAQSLWVGGLVGYAASRTMDRATSWVYSRQSEASRRREEELAPGGALRQVGLQLGRASGRELSDERAERLGLAVHRSLGVSYGVMAAGLVLAGVRPRVAGLGVAAAAWAIVDEGTALSQFTAYPVASHVRGLVGHGTHGLLTAMLLSQATGD